MKHYSVSFRISIHDKATSYPEVKPIDITVSENLPANVDPQKHLRQRIAEELARNFAAMTPGAIDNRTEDAPKDDPLTGGPIPF